mmetsp:Transcript_26986/g.56563  ORF Transcript_26986/g.56563 Transcript_26986/m.56563 type:complete len:219 (-) Transcript_26986:165-821(-)
MLSPIGSVYIFLKQNGTVFGRDKVFTGALQHAIQSKSRETHLGIGVLAIAIAFGSLTVKVTVTFISRVGRHPSKEFPLHSVSLPTRSRTSIGCSCHGTIKIRIWQRLNKNNLGVLTAKEWADTAVAVGMLVLVDVLVDVIVAVAIIASIVDGIVPTMVLDNTGTCTGHSATLGYRGGTFVVAQNPPCTKTVCHHCNQRKVIPIARQHFSSPRWVDLPN